ncbi:MAG TPA: carbohydrate kinase [Candidatus Pseudogracilibacillus intestinigallinarum]|uniref:Carbohydrate kinase n=1 Tax=Candidatus Pseudogracilibacillus intestinigallinarum TaxID=2838742 RepID=A0A9D1PNT5_9BACI|nr:carbohydrate kinase [Candidatus Pseudogracilibacillus intestinigallinarum]
MVHVTAIGEILIDFTPVSSTDTPTYMQHVGGAPANVLAVLSKLGKETAFIGKVGKDNFGAYIRRILKEFHIDTTQVVETEAAHTTITFVHLDETGDRSFTFYRKLGADTLLSVEELDEASIRNTEVFHFGSISLTHDTSCEATFQAVKIAKEAGALLSFDVNLREDVWDDVNVARERIEKALTYVDVVKFSEEELTFLTGETDVEKGAAKIRETYHIPYIFVTLGAAGCYYMWHDFSSYVSSYIVYTIDTTGAGDAFMGSILYGILQSKTLPTLSIQEVEEIISFANAVAALTTTKLGAFASFPKLEDVKAFIGENSTL